MFYLDLMEDLLIKDFKLKPFQIEKLKDLLYFKYNEPHRKYHNWGHIHDMLMCFKHYYKFVENPGEFLMGILFHDIEYVLFDEKMSILVVYLLKIF